MLFDFKLCKMFSVHGFTRYKRKKSKLPYLLVLLIIDLAKKNINQCTNMTSGLLLDLGCFVALFFFSTPNFWHSLGFFPTAFPLVTIHSLGQCHHPHSLSYHFILTTLQSASPVQSSVQNIWSLHSVVCPTLDFLIQYYLKFSMYRKGIEHFSPKPVFFLYFQSQQMTQSFPTVPTFNQSPSPILLCKNIF